MQIVLSGNRVIAHGEDCFLAMGGTVICEETGKAYPNATIAEVDAIPADVDSVGYEYRAGVFVPCAPYGKTQKGRLMLSCDECGAPRSSDLTSENGGLHIPGVLSGAKMPADILSLLGMTDGYLADAFAALKNGDVRIITGQYTGTGASGTANTRRITFPGTLLLAAVWKQNTYWDLSVYPHADGGWDSSLLWLPGMGWSKVNGQSITVQLSGNELSWYTSATNSGYEEVMLNAVATYKYALFVFN